VRVLVVCTANVARSPLAEAMLAASFADSDVEVASAGTRVRPGHPAAQNTQRLAEARGLDLTEHLSRPVTEELVRGASLVLTMSERHRDRCAPLAAGAGAHVFTVREFVRLLQAADLTDAPADVTQRLPWTVERAHLARPAAPPPSGREDVRDPIRAPWPEWLEMGATLDDLLGSVVRAFGFGPGWTPPRYPDQDEPGQDELVSAADARRGARPRPRWLRRSRS
jgi:protein-tyrosine phosphatase